MMLKLIINRFCEYIDKTRMVISVAVAKKKPTPAHIPNHLIFKSYKGFAFQDPDFIKDPFQGWLALEETPDLFYKPGQYGMPGGWVVKSAKFVREVLHNSDPFSSSMAEIDSRFKTWPRQLLPLEMDPPEHAKYRRLLTELLSSRAVKNYNDDIVQVVKSVLAPLEELDSFDFMAEVARPIPVKLFCKLMGFPDEDQEKIVQWELEMFQPTNILSAKRAGLAINAYLKGLIQQRQQKPQNDFVSTLINSKIDGRPIPNEILEDMCFLLFIAGLDTVTSALGHIIRFLAENQQQRNILLESPECIPKAIEEILRAYAWVVVGRTLSRDYDFHGISMKKGDQVECILFLANRDSDEVKCPNEIDFHRHPNSHFTFSAGVHQCAGLHLARSELQVVLIEFLQRFPNFHIKENVDLTYDGGLVTLKSLPLEIG